MDFDDFQTEVLHELAELRSTRSSRILAKNSAPETFGNSFLSLAIADVVLNFSLDRGDTIVTVGRAAERETANDHTWLLERVLHQRMQDRSTSAYCNLVKERFADLEAAFSEEQFPATIHRLETEKTAAQRFAEM